MSATISYGGRREQYGYEENIVGYMHSRGDSSRYKNLYDEIWLRLDVINQEVSLRQLDGEIKCLQKELDKKRGIYGKKAIEYTKNVQDIFLQSKERLERDERELEEIKIELARIYDENSSTNMVFGSI